MTVAICREATIGADGRYSVQPSAPLPNGSYTFVARTRDVAGNVSGNSPAISIQILNTTYTKPTLGLVQVDDSGVPGDNITNVTRPRLQGTGGPGLYVQLIDVDGKITGTPGSVITPVDFTKPIRIANDKTFLVQFPTDLKDGTYTVLARTYDIAGNAVNSDAARY